MKINVIMLTITGVIALWLTASFLTPVPTDSYDQATFNNKSRKDLSVSSEPALKATSDVAAAVQ